MVRAFTFVKGIIARSITAQFVGGLAKGHPNHGLLINFKEFVDKPLDLIIVVLVGWTLNPHSVLESFKSPAHN